MFAQASRQIHECIYGLLAFSQLPPNQVATSNGTAFMISPGVLATAAHIVHIATDHSQPLHSRFQVIRSPEIGQDFEEATLIASDSNRDIALLRVQNPRSILSVQLATDIIQTGTSCGSLGFPLSTVEFSNHGAMLKLVERFQGSNISTYAKGPHPSGRDLGFYETDSLMYAGSSGCPGFLEDGRVFAMHVASRVEPAVAKANAGNQAAGNRLAISLWVPASDIRDYALASAIPM